MTEPIIPLIMCGGAGTRLWPASREGRPKQFLALFGPRSTFQDTIRRVGDPKIFGTPDHRHQSSVSLSCRRATQLRSASRPISCSSRIAAIPLRQSSRARSMRCGGAKAPIVLALAADHVVTDTDAFVAACLAARTAAARGIHRDVRQSRPSDRRPSTATSAAARSSVDGVFAAETVRREARRGDGAQLRRGRLSVELRQFRFRRSAHCSTSIGGFDPDSAAAVTAAVEGAGYRSRLRDAQRRMTFARATAKSIDYAVHGEDLARRRGAGVLWLVRRRLVARRVGIDGARTLPATPRAGPVRRIRGIPTPLPTKRRSALLRGRGPGCRGDRGRGPGRQPSKP